MFIAGSRIISVFANALNDPHGLNNTVSINLKFENGSIANLSYFSNGAKRLPKELIEVSCGETTAIIDDFRKMTVYGKTTTSLKLKSQDKGHSQEMKEYLDSIRNGLPCPIPFTESYLSTLATFKVIESLKDNRVINL